MATAAAAHVTFNAVTHLSPSVGLLPLTVAASCLGSLSTIWAMTSTGREGPSGSAHSAASVPCVRRRLRLHHACRSSGLRAATDGGASNDTWTEGRTWVHTEVGMREGLEGRSRRWRLERHLRRQAMVGVRWGEGLKGCDGWKCLKCHAVGMCLDGHTAGWVGMRGLATVSNSGASNDTCINATDGLSRLVCV